MEVVVKIKKCQCGYWEHDKSCTQKDCPRYKANKKQFSDLIKILALDLKCDVYVQEV